MQASDLHIGVNMALERNFRLVQLDECVITKNTKPKHAWTLPKSNICIDQKEFYTKP